MTGNLTQVVRLTNVAASATGSDAANKTYVDTVAAGNSEFDNLRDTQHTKSRHRCTLSITLYTMDNLYTTQVIKFYS